MSERIAFYNLDNNRDDDVVREELLGAAERGYAVLGLCETIGNRLVDLKGYERIADNTTRSRQNIAAYIRKDIPILDVEWHDLSFRWPRTDGPGIHEARSWLEVAAGRRGTQLMVGHQPPKGAVACADGQMEGIDLCTRRMAPWTHQRWTERLSAQQREARRRPRLAMADWNRRPGEYPGGDLLAKRLKGNVHGSAIDYIVERNVEVLDWRYVTRFADVPLRSDHGHAFEAEVEAL